MATLAFDGVPILERAKTALNIKSDAELARELGVSTATTTGYRKRQSLPMEQCVKISEKTGVSLDWLILGKGEMQPENAHKDEDEQDNENMTFVPLYDISASAGSGAEVYDEEIKRHIPFERSWLLREGLYLKNLACIEVKGDSMLPTLENGDIILVNHAKTTGDGVFIIRMGNALRVKRLQWLVSGKLRISSDNPAYETEVVTPEELGEQFAILGACHTQISRIR